MLKGDQKKVTSLPPPNLFEIFHQILDPPPPQKKKCSYLPMIMKAGSQRRETQHLEMISLRFLRSYVIIKSKLL